MYNTYNSFKEIASEPRDCLEMLVEYQATMQPPILARLFCDHFRLMLAESQNYKGLTSPDVASFAVEELHKAALDFDAARGNKFSTLLCNYFRNRLRKETEATNADKRKTIQYSLSMDEQEIKFPRTEDDTSASHIVGIQLTANEERYCRFLMQTKGKVFDRDAAREFGISTTMIYYMKYSLHKKLKPLVLC